MDAAITWMTVPVEPGQDADKDAVSGKERKPDPHAIFDQWWPIVARVSGVGLATIHVLLAQFGQGDVDPAVLTFCGTLVLLSASGKKDRE